MTRAALAAAALAALVLGGCGGSSAPALRGSQPPEGIDLPRFSLRDYRGATVSDASLRGKAVALTFLDTACRESCPVIAHQAAAAWRLLSPDERARIAVYAITVDPRVDTPARIRSFLRRQRAESAVGYLVGTTSRLRPVWRAFSVLPAVDSGTANVHSAPVRIYTPGGRWVSTLTPTVDLTPANLANDLRSALRR